MLLSRLNKDFIIIFIYETGTQFIIEKKMEKQGINKKKIRETGMKLNNEEIIQAKKWWINGKKKDPSKIKDEGKKLKRTTRLILSAALI